MVLEGWGRFDGKSRLWRDEAGERGGGSVFADPLSGASAPDPPFPRSPAALALTTTSTSIHP